MKGITQFQKEQILARYENESSISIAASLNIHISKVNYWGPKLGLKKSAQQIESTRWKSDQESGIRYRFKKGHIPYNKGKKMPEHLREKVKPTMFKKGNKPHNTKPVGTINIRPDTNGTPYQYIKIADSNWKLLGRYIWEQHNGTIPPGHRIHHKDGNVLNCEIENLEMLSPKQAIDRNTIMRFPPELRETIKLNKKLIRKIESYGKE